MDKYITIKEQDIVDRIEEIKIIQKNIVKMVRESYKEYGNSNIFYDMKRIQLDYFSKLAYEFKFLNKLLKESTIDTNYKVITEIDYLKKLNYLEELRKKEPDNHTQSYLDGRIKELKEIWFL